MSEPIKFQHFEVETDASGAPVVLGRGAMGVTYRAMDTNLRCPVALKVIIPSLLADSIARQRFLREARTAASLRHPNVANVLFLGEEEGEVFYVMEYVEGVTLDAELKSKGVLDWREVLVITMAVTKALAAAHRVGLVHRDIKPSNIMLVRRDGETEVKLIDFGLAKLMGGEFTGETLAAASAVGFQGTPHFASPEQINNEETDIRSDLYALGVTVFAMLTGRAPFEGTLAQVLSKHLAQPPPLDALPKEAMTFQPVLSKMLAKDPAERFQTPAGLRAALEEIQESLEHSGQNLHGTIGLPEGVDQKKVFAWRYLQEPQQLLLSHATIQRATRLKDKSQVGLIFFEESPGAAEALNARITALREIASPHVMAVHGLENDGKRSAIVTEWIEGLTLLDLLKSRRSLPPWEAGILLVQIARGLDAMAQAGHSVAAITPGDILLSPAEVQRKPLNTVFPLRAAILAAWPEQNGAFAADATIVGTPPQAFEHLSPAAILAGIAYETLGGIRSEGGWTPISALSAEANTLLHSARHGNNPAESASALVAKLTPTLGTSPPQSKQSPPQKAEPLAPQRLPAKPQPPPLPPPGSKAPLVVAVVLFCLLLLSAIVGTSLHFLTRTPSEAPQLTILEKPTEPELRPPPPPTVEPEVAPTPTPGPGDEFFRLAEDAKLRDDYATAIENYARVASTLPAAKDQLEMITAMMRSGAFRMDTEKFASLRGPLEMAAGRGVVSAQMVLAENLRPTNPAESLMWFETAATLGQTEAMTQAGLMLASGVGVGQPNFEAAVRWFEKGAEKGDTDSIYALAECLAAGKGVAADRPRAVELLRAAVAFNHPAAFVLLGDLSLQGVPGVMEPDRTEAFRLFSDADAMGSLDGQAKLGVMFANGWGTPPMPQKAMELWKEGAELGDPLSMFNLAVAFQNGLAGKKQPAEAKTWFQAAARKGHAGARDWCQKNRVSWD
ncbi:MAG: protein kinase [Terrimicrobiaceae bacterium]